MEQLHLFKYLLLLIYYSMNEVKLSFYDKLEGSQALGTSIEAWKGAGTITELW